MKALTFCIVLLMVLFINSPLLSQPDANCVIPLWENWQIETYEDTRGVTGILYDSLNKCLIVTVNLKGQDAAISKGEIFLDLRWLSLPCIDSLKNVNNSQLINLSGKTLIVTLDVPNIFIGPKSAPNGLQLFAKSGKDFNSAYSAWKSITAPGEITLLFDFKNGPFGFKKPNYNAANIASIGVKFAINTSSIFAYKGTFKIKSIKIK